jgi:hypothetical protein
MSLEDVFLKLTAAEKSAAAVPEPVEAAAAQDGAQ